MVDQVIKCDYCTEEGRKSERIQCWVKTSQEPEEQQHQE